MRVGNLAFNKCVDLPIPKEVSMIEIIQFEHFMALTLPHINIPMTSAMLYVQPPQELAQDFINNHENSWPESIL